MEIEVKKNEDNTSDELVFILKNVETPFVNAIRRAAMMEVPKLAIEDVNIIVNDSAMFNEVLAHRLGLVPLNSDKEALEGLIDENSTVSFTLNKVNDTEETIFVYSKDLTSNDPKIKPVFDTIPLLKLKKGEKVDLEAVAKLGNGRSHAKWMPTVVCAYKQYPDISFVEGKTVSKSVVDSCPRNILSFNEDTKEVSVNNVENCSMCKTCVRTSQNDSNDMKSAINIGYIEDTFIFRIETDGSMSPEEVLLNACDVLNQKSDKFITFFKGG
ncbi:MAG: DNA-directed RNA polymerase subunit D [Methanobrevibacter sp.]|nr:DNA-directed RNA polymerase subunit D [Candidatus Methanoflexus mossambicus]